LRAPHSNADAAVRSFASQAFGWAVEAVEIARISGSSGPRFVAVSTTGSDLATQLLLAPDQRGTWQIFQVGPNDGGSVGTAEKIEYPVPPGAATMHACAFVNGRTLASRAQPQAQSGWRTSFCATEAPSELCSWCTAMTPVRSWAPVVV
jgi:hypothetical protein